MTGRRTALACAATGALLASLVGPSATANVVASGSETVDLTSTQRNFCGSKGLTAQREGQFTLRYRIGSRGPDGTPYYMEHVAVNETWTNARNGRFVSVTSTTLDKDLKVTDNRNGTFTILVLATGSFSIRDMSGKLIGADPGQVRFEILIDNNGTPSDPSDDSFLEFLGLVKGSTGRSDDFCAVVVPALS